MYQKPGKLPTHWKSEMPMQWKRNSITGVLYWAHRISTSFDAEVADYDESLEPDPNEQEAAHYREQLHEEEEREFLLRRFSGEIDVTDC